MSTNFESNTTKRLNGHYLNLLDTTRAYLALEQKVSNGETSWSGLRRLEQRRMNEVVATLEAAAATGNAGAMFSLGVIHLKGHGVHQNDAEGFRWTRRSAALGLARAEFNLGLMYYEGRGVAQSSATAALFWQRASDQHDCDAQFNLGVLYQIGKGVSRNSKEAMRLFALAADAGDENAACELEMMHRNSWRYWLFSWGRSKPLVREPDFEAL